MSHSEPLWKAPTLEDSLQRQVDRSLVQRRLNIKTNCTAPVVQQNDDKKRQAAVRHSTVRTHVKWSQDEQTALNAVRPCGPAAVIFEEKRILHNRLAESGDQHYVLPFKMVGKKMNRTSSCAWCKLQIKRNQHMAELYKRKCPSRQNRQPGKRFTEEAFVEKKRNLLVRINNAGHSVDLGLAAVGSGDCQIVCDACKRTVPGFRRAYELLKAKCNNSG